MRPTQASKRVDNCEPQRERIKRYPIFHNKPSWQEEQGKGEIAEGEGDQPAHPDNRVQPRRDQVLEMHDLLLRNLRAQEH